MATTAPQFEATQTPTTTYRAAVVHDFHGPLTVEQVPRRELRAGQVRVKVEASGLCHTDIHAAHGDWPVKPSPPFVPGHEGVGIVVELGPGVTEVAARRSRRDAVAGLRVRRLRLLRLRAGRRSASSSRTWATRSTAASASTPSPTRATSSRSPTGVDPFDAAPLTCAGVTTYKAVKVAGHALVRPRRRLRRRRPRPPGDPVRRDRRRPGRSPSTSLDEKLELASELGAEFTVNAAKEDPVEAIQRARRRRPGDRAGGLAARVRAGLRLAAPRRHAGLRRAARRQRGQAPDLRDRAQRDHRRRLDRRHPRRPARGLRAARRRPDRA